MADTVDDINPTNLTLGTASGIVFDEAQDHALLQAVERAVALFQNKPQWEKLQRTGMNKDFSWQTSAKLYEKLYELAEADRNRVGHSMLIARA